MSPFEVWIRALVPSEQNYIQIAREPKATAGRAYLWLIIVFLVGSFISTVIGLGVSFIFGVETNPFFPIFASVPSGPVTLESSVISLVCGVPLNAVVLLIGVTLLAGLSHLLALALRGKGHFSQLIYTYSAFYVPIFIIDSFIFSIPYVNLLIYATSLYALVLSVIATKAVHQFGWGKAATAALLVPILSLLLVAGLIALGLWLLSRINLSPSGA